MSGAHTGCIDWPRTAAAMTSTQASAADVAKARELAAAETMGAYPKPVPMPSPPGELYRVRGADLTDWTDAERSAAKAYAYQVTRAEECNHGSLLALLEAIATLRASGDETARECAGELARRVWHDYPGIRTCLRGEPLPETLRDRRRLARAASRDYGRCPRLWRYL